MQGKNNQIEDSAPDCHSDKCVRKSPRASFSNYLGGDYFVTMCTKDKAHYFGTIANGEIHYTSLGYYCRQQLDDITLHYPYAQVRLYVVMPNHIHAIIHIEDSSEKDLQKGFQFSQLPNHRMALGVVVGGFKRDVTLYAKRNYIQFGWQGRYHDHVIRGARDGNRIVDYIKTNVMRWDNDCFFDE